MRHSIDNNLDISWLLSSLADNPNISYKQFMNLFDLFKASKKDLLDCCGLFEKPDFEYNPEYDKYYCLYCKSLFLPEELLVQKSIVLSTFSNNESMNYPELNCKVKKKLWYRQLSKNPAITWQTVKQFPNQPWKFEQLSKNPSIPYRIIKNWPIQLRNYQKISKNKSLIADDVIADIHKPWDIFVILDRKDFTFSQKSRILRKLTKIDNLLI